MELESKQHEHSLESYLSPAGAWAFALGTSIGWGSLVVTSNSYLLQAGPWGSILGLLIGMIVMLIVGRCYHYLINCYPDAGGAYTYAKRVFGYDQGFLVAWFLFLTYIAIFWANVTSLPLFAHYFIGDIFKTGYLYTIFDYKVYFGEAMLSIGAILIVAFCAMRSRKGIMYLMIGLAVLFTASIAACFIASCAGFTLGGGSMEPGFLPDKGALSQVVLIACISPWAYIGFENISHSADEYAFSRSKVFRIMLVAVGTATVLYILVFLMSTMAYPPEYGSWLEYLQDLGNLEGIKALPPFYVAYHYMGDAGIVILMLALLGLVVTSLFGNTIALSRLIYAVGCDDLIPKRWFAAINEHKVPANAVLLMAVISLFIPFLGRTAIGWIVDVTTIGATIVYGIVCASAGKMAKAQGDRAEQITSVVGVVFMVAIGVYLLVPVLFGAQSLETESYFLFAAWGIVGFAFFRAILNRDKERRFGRSTVVWIALLALVLFVSFVWMSQAVMSAVNDTSDQVLSYYYSEVALDAQKWGEGRFIEEQFSGLHNVSSTTMLIAAALFALAAALLLSNFSYMSKWAKETEDSLRSTRESAYTDPLTGLLSTSRFQKLAKGMGAAIEASGDKPVVLAFNLLGIQDFQARHDHDRSDRLLCDFADVLKKWLGTDNCSRFAEDRFYAVAALEGAADRVEAVFADFSRFEDSLPVLAGAYTCVKGDDISTTGVDRARAACNVRQAKWESSLSWYSESISDEARLRLHVLGTLDEAIEKRWIRPYYQPVVRSSTSEVCHEEALARWIDPEFGFLSPGQFIPVLEEAGMLHKVDLHILDCVLEDFAAKRQQGVPVVSVSVNISMSDLLNVDVAEEVAKRVDAAGESHELICIEFTESVASEQPELFKSTVGKLRAAGFEIWMDDFGSGYSSLNSMKDFDFDTVKLDMEFMRNDKNEKTWDVISGIALICDRLGMKMLAEGVETENQATRLAVQHCDMLQGFYFSKPLPLEEVISSYQDGTGRLREGD